MLLLREWLNSESYRRVAELSMGDLVSREFFRDPLRAIYQMPEMFYAPADGTILYAFENLGPKEAIVNIKGKKFTPREALDDDDYNERSICIGIFMSSADVHTQRAPTQGYLKEARCTPFLYTPNLEMLTEEQDILQDAQIKPEDMAYLKMNERKIVSIYYPKIRTTYYVIQIAEKDVDCILNWNKQGFMLQGERFGQVRFGSQVDMIIPLNGKIKYEVLAKRGLHCEAGIDPLVRIINP